MVKPGCHILKSSPYSNAQSQTIAMGTLIEFEGRYGILFFTKLLIISGLTTRKCLYGFDSNNHFQCITRFCNQIKGLGCFSQWKTMCNYSFWSNTPVT